MPSTFSRNCKSWAWTGLQGCFCSGQLALEISSLITLYSLAFWISHPETQSRILLICSSGVLATQPLWKHFIFIFAMQRWISRFRSMEKNGAFWCLASVTDIFAQWSPFSHDSFWNIKIDDLNKWKATFLWLQVLRIVIVELVHLHNGLSYGR